ncbi:MAG: hypothetical protein WCF85_08855 [Rhodospirillaceae bacterium]
MKDSPSAERPTLQGPGQGPGQDFSAVNDQSLIRVGLTFAVCMLMASTAPLGLVFAILNGLLAACAIMALAVAAVLRDRVFAPHLTRWDEAAALAAASLISGWFVDPDAVRATLEAMERMGG